MDKIDVENLMAERIREAVEEAAAACVGELNGAGHGFVEQQHGVLEWVDARTAEVLSVHCGVGVSLEDAGPGKPAFDPVVDAFVAAASTGFDPLATVLDRVEGDLANGGLSLLFVNQDLEFVREAVSGLRSVGALATADLVDEALALYESRAEVVAGFDRLMAEMQALDERIDGLDDDIPALFLEHRGIEV